MRSINKEEALRKRAINYWKLSGEAVNKFVNFSPEPGYCSFSRRALKKLLPYLEQGLSTTEAIQKVYPDKIQQNAVDKIPPIENLRNPIVQRALAEMRRVVNCIIAKYGKPNIIRVELARELKKSARERERYMNQMEQNEKARKRAQMAIAEVTGVQNPSRFLIEKYLLWEECNHICPYSGKSISLTELLSDSSKFDIDHIIPFTRSMDDSFANKTLCYVEINRNIKKNQTPWETWGAPAEAGDTKKREEWENIINRVKKFSSHLKNEKLRRFLLKTVDDETKFIENFATSQLNDTRYAAKKTREILAQLYGSEGLKHVQAVTGQITAYLRRAWNLNSITGGEGSKERSDHRHHAIDAICIALTSPAVVFHLHNSAKKGVLKGRQGTFPEMWKPWQGFLDEVKNVFNNIIVSHRVSNKVRGKLHEETHYG
ncbi:MAG: type II CRISPR RNA-guided endonuclease Cas9, partial [Candidatus Sumerlaeia bacterium]|nr:type II CRISPR RNA-guided endonuclease Cas9 [Candidatus Sumerlaeia bacterium]